MKSLWQKIVLWWQNQKFVLLKWLPGMIDKVITPLIEKEIENNRERIIKELNSFSARENAKKASNWLKEKLGLLAEK